MPSPVAALDAAAAHGLPDRSLRRAPAIRAAARQDGAFVEVIRDRAGFDAIVADWLALEGEARGALVFQSSGWARAVFDAAAARGNPASTPVILTLREQGRLSAVLPLELKASRLRRALVPLGDGYAQYAELLVRPDVDAKAALAAMLAALPASLRIDTVAFRHVRADSSLALALPEAARPIGEADAAPFVAFDGHADFAAYLQTIRLKTRKNIRNDWNRLERDAPLRHEIAATPQAQRIVVTRTMAGRAERLRESGLTSRAFADQAFLDFCAGLPGRNDANFGIMALSLLHGDVPISDQWGFVHNRRFYLYVTTRDFAASEVSPGKLHMREMLAACRAAGIDTADLMVPAMPYKLTWATGTVAVTDYALDLTWRGRAVTRIWDGWLRPLLKHTVLAMPIGPRTLLMRLAGRA